jgi:hypothetical protein
MRRITLPAALIVAGLLIALAAAGCSAAAGGVAPGRAAPGSVGGCTAFAYRAIRVHSVVAGLPAECRGLSRAQVNDAVSTAIRLASPGPKTAWRRQAAAAAPWVSALLTGPVRPPAVGVGVAAAPSAPGGSRLGGVSELAVQVAALLAWLATAMSGGYVLLRWLRAGGRLRGHTERSGGMAAPPAVIAAHVAFGLLGLLLWAGFMITGWGVLAWTAVGLLGPVAGLGMGVLLLGLPSPRPRLVPGAAAPSAVAAPAAGGTATLLAPAQSAAPARARVPVFVIAAHGLFAAALLLLVITATIGAG